MIGIPYGQHLRYLAGHLAQGLFEGRALETAPLSGPLAEMATWEGYRAEDGFWREWRMTTDTVSLTVKYWIQVSGLASSDFAFHSLRAGLATQAARQSARS